jgi:hypothetical protein
VGCGKVGTSQPGLLICLVVVMGKKAAVHHMHACMLDAVVACCGLVRRGLLLQGSGAVRGLRYSSDNVQAVHLLTLAILVVPEMS